MSKNRKRSKTRSLVSYANECLTPQELGIKPRPVLLQHKKYTFGLPSELTRSPVHGFYAQVKTD